MNLPSSILALVVWLLTCSALAEDDGETSPCPVDETYYVDSESGCSVGTEGCPMTSISEVLTLIDSEGRSVACESDVVTIYLTEGEYDEDIKPKRSLRLVGTADLPSGVTISGNIQNAAPRLELVNLRVANGGVYNWHDGVAVRLSDVEIHGSTGWGYYQHGGTCDIENLSIKNTGSSGAVIEGDAEVRAYNVELQTNQEKSWVQQGGLLEGELWRIALNSGDGLEVHGDIEVALNDFEVESVDGVAFIQRGGIVEGSGWTFTSNGSGITIVGDVETSLYSLEVRRSSGPAVNQVGGLVEGSDWTIVLNNSGVVVENGYFDLIGLQSTMNLGPGFIARGVESLVYLRDSAFNDNRVNGDCSDPLAALGALFEEGALGDLSAVQANHNEGPGLVVRGADTAVNYSGLEVNNNLANECYATDQNADSLPNGVAGVYIAGEATLNGIRLDAIGNQGIGVSVRDSAEAYLTDTLATETQPVLASDGELVFGHNIESYHYSVVELCHVETSHAFHAGFLQNQGTMSVNYGVSQSNMIGVLFLVSPSDLLHLGCGLNGSAGVRGDCLTMSCSYCPGCSGDWIPSIRDPDCLIYEEVPRDVMYRDNERDTDTSFLPIPSP